MRKIDISEKLNFEENPKIVIKGVEYEVNSDATTMLKVLEIVGDGRNFTANDFSKIYECLFSDTERKKIEKLKLSFNDFRVFIESAMKLVQGDLKDMGE